MIKIITGTAINPKTNTREPFAGNDGYIDGFNVLKEIKFSGIVAGKNHKFICYENGMWHRDNNLPAVESANGYKGYYVNGNLHRDNGLPTIEYADGG